MSQTTRNVLFAGGLLLAAALLPVAYVSGFLLTPRQGHSTVVEIEVRRGDTFAAVARELHREGLVSQPRMFAL